MFAFLLLTVGEQFGYPCVIAGFLVIVASVFFVIKGKAVLGESGAPNTVEWGKIKTNLTSAVALFVLGAAMVVVPFWRLMAEESQATPQAVITGKIKEAGRDVRLILVEKPDYDQTYRGDIVWQVPLLARKASYLVFYVDGDSILGQQAFSVKDATPGGASQQITLPELDLQTHNTIAQEITPQLEVSNEELKSLSLR